MALTKIDDRGLKTPIDLIDNEKIRFGTGNDLEIFSGGTGAKIHCNTGVLEIEGDSVQIWNHAANEAMAKFTADGAVELYNNNTKRFETTAGGAKVTGTLLTTGTITGEGHIKTGSDTGKFLAGASNDLSIYHDGSASRIDNVTGSLILRVNTDEKAISCVPNGAVELYYNNVEKLKTDSDCFYNPNNGDYIAVSSNGQAKTGRFGYHSDYKLYIENVRGTHTKLILDNDGKIISQISDGSNLQDRFEINANGAKIPDNLKFIAGTGDDLSIYHTSSNSHSNIRHINTAGNLYIDSAGSTNFRHYIDTGGTISFETYATFNDDGAVELYHDGTKKLETTSEGIAISSSTPATVKIEDTGGYQGYIQMRGNDLEIRGSSGQIEFYQGNADGASSSEKFRISSHGGVTFNGDTAAANCLDDYEEGTWTPAISFNANTGITYDTAGADATGGTYTKIGRQVTLHGTINLTSKGSSTGDAKIQGLPFSSSGDDNNRGCGSVGYVTGMNLDGPVLILEERGGQTWFYLRALNANFDGSYTLTNSSFTDGSRFFFSYTYNVS